MSRKDKALITQRAYELGFESVSTYLRSLALGQTGISVEQAVVEKKLSRITELAHALRLSYGDNAIASYRDREIHSDWEAFFQTLYELEACLLNLEEPDHGTRANIQE